MKGNAAFQRKVIYFCAMAALLVPLYAISHPETRKSGGGWLAQLRTEHQLSSGQFGEIDPASASMNLATLGLRGVAANILWGKALHYKKTEDFNAMKATANQIAKLQPHFVSIWRFQSWELAYNVAAEFDDYRHRYNWVKKGVGYLQDGIKYNRFEPMLLWELGWFFGHKLGRSDDRRQFRRMYSDDDDFHETLLDLVDIPQTLGPDNKPDSWKTSWQSHLLGQEIVDTRNVPLRGKNPLIFHSEPAMALIYYGVAIEKEGHLDEHAQSAWRAAGIAFNEYGDRDLATSTGRQIRLNDLERYDAEAERLRQELDALVPDVRDRLTEERTAKLSPEEQEALETPREERNYAQMELAAQAAGKIRVTHGEVARQASPQNRRKAMTFGKRAVETKAIADAIDNYRTTVNYDYWRTRCEAEQTDTMIEARKSVYEAKDEYARTRLVAAREKFERAWDLWAQIYDQYPILLQDPTAEDNAEAIQTYAELLGQDEEDFPPPDFKLQRLLDMHSQPPSRPIDTQDKQPPSANSAEDGS